MDLPVEAVELLKHADVEGKELNWNLQVNANAVTTKLIWIKAVKPIATIGEVTSQVPKTTHMSPSKRTTSKSVEGEKESSLC
jgi:N-acetylmuramoyl-L-alanine amidase CwlA